MHVQQLIQGNKRNGRKYSSEVAQSTIVTSTADTESCANRSPAEIDVASSDGIKAKIVNEQSRL